MEINANKIIDKMTLQIADLVKQNIILQTQIEVLQEKEEERKQAIKVKE